MAPLFSYALPGRLLVRLHGVLPPFGTPLWSEEGLRLFLARWRRALTACGQMRGQYVNVLVGREVSPFWLLAAEVAARFAEGGWLGGCGVCGACAVSWASGAWGAGTSFSVYSLFCGSGGGSWR